MWWSHPINCSLLLNVNWMQTHKESIECKDFMGQLSTYGPQTTGITHTHIVVQFLPQGDYAQCLSDWPGIITPSHTHSGHMHTHQWEFISTVKGLAFLEGMWIACRLSCLSFRLRSPRVEKWCSWLFTPFLGQTLNIMSSLMRYLKMSQSDPEFWMTLIYYCIKV